MSIADNKELEEAVNYFKKRMDICLENAEICDENDFDEEATRLRKEQILIETVLKELERLQEENIEYRKQLDLDYVRENFIHKDEIIENKNNTEKQKLEFIYNMSKNHV